MVNDALIRDRSSQQKHKLKLLNVRQHILFGVFGIFNKYRVGIHTLKAYSSRAVLESCVVFVSIE